MIEDMNWITVAILVGGYLILLGTSGIVVILHFIYDFKRTYKSENW